MGIKSCFFKKRNKERKSRKRISWRERKSGEVFPEEAVGNWSYMGSCKGSLKGEVWKGRGKGFQEKHSDLKKEKSREKKNRVGERQRETTQEGRND